MSVREAASGPDREVALDDLGARAGEAAEDASRPDPEVVPVGSQAVPSRRPWVAGALGASWALFVGLALVSFLVVGAWALSVIPAGDSGAAWRAVGLTWLGAHQTPLQVSGLPVTVLPLGAVLAGLLLTRRGGGWSARLVPDPSIAELGALVGGAALAYGAGGAVVAWLSGTPRTGASLLAAFTTCAAVAALGALWGIGRELDLPGRMADRVSQGVWRTLLAGSAGALGLFVLGAGLVSLSLIAHAGDSARSLAAVDGGVLAAVGLTLVDILTLPTLAVWGAALAAGPGFSLGDLGGLSAFGGEVAAMPALPVLVAIPATAPTWAPVLLVGPIACGVIAGRVRWREDLPSWPGALVTALGIGAVVAPLVAAAALLTSGSVGGGALAQVGPEVGPVTAAAVGLLVLGFLGDAAAQSLRLSWDLHQAEQRRPVDAEARPDDGSGRDGALRYGANAEAPAAPGDREPVPSRPIDRTGGSSATAGTPDALAASTADDRPDGATTRGQALTSAMFGVGSAARSRVVWVAGATMGQLTGGAASRVGPATTIPDPGPGAADPDSSAPGPNEAPSDRPEAHEDTRTGATSVDPEESDPQAVDAAIKWADLLEMPSEDVAAAVVSAGVDGVRSVAEQSPRPEAPSEAPELEAPPSDGTRAAAAEADPGWAAAVFAELAASPADGPAAPAPGPAEEPADPDLAHGADSSEASDGVDPALPGPPGRVDEPKVPGGPDQTETPAQ